jgi:rubrerythrin
MGNSRVRSHTAPVGKERGQMVESFRAGRKEPDGYVSFWAAGELVKGEFHCSECGYGVAVRRELPRCPMCGGTVWEQAAWSPITRAREQLL